MSRVWRARVLDGDGQPIARSEAYYGGGFDDEVQARIWVLGVLVGLGVPIEDYEVRQDADGDHWGVVTGTARKLHADGPW